MDKLENLLVRLESAITKIELSAKGELVADNENEVISALKKLFSEFTQTFIPLSVKIGSTVGKTAEIVCDALVAGITLVSEIYNRLPLVDAQIEAFYKPLTDICKFPRAPMGMQDSFCKALEKVPDVFFFITDNRPTDWVKEAVSSVEFYNNRVMTRKEHELALEWSIKLSKMLKSLVQIVDDSFENRKIKFIGTANPQSLPAPAPISPPAANTSSGKPQPKILPPTNVFNADKNLHQIDNQTGGTIEITAQLSHSVFINNCSNTNIVIHGKINSLTVNSCTATAVILTSCISQIDLIRSNSIRLQVSSFAPTFNIENCDNVKLFLHENCYESEILTFFASGVQIIQLEEVEGNLVGGEIEVDLPSHFQHQWKGKSVKTVSVEACGE